MTADITIHHVSPDRREIVIEHDGTATPAEIAEALKYQIKSPALLSEDIPPYTPPPSLLALRRPLTSQRPR